MSTLKADTIVASDGTSPVTLTKQSAAKTWVNFNGTGTIATRTSFNVSSLTDNGTGDYTVTFSNAFSDESSANMTGGRSMFHYSSTGNTSNIRFRSKTLADALSDTTILTQSAHGDLA
jgi:hypothetical protein